MLKNSSYLGLIIILSSSWLYTMEPGRYQLHSYSPAQPMYVLSQSIPPYPTAIYTPAILDNNASIANLHNELLSLKRQISSLQRLYDKIVQQRIIAEDCHREEIDDLTQKIAELTDTNNNLYGKNRFLEHCVMELTDIKTQLHEQNTNLITQNRELITQHNNLKSVCGNYKKTNGQLRKQLEGQQKPRQRTHTK